MNTAREALKRAVANGKPIDWDVIAPPKPNMADELIVRRSEPTDEGFRPRPAHCPICRATVMVRRSRKLSDRLMRCLALADHVRTLHPSVAS